MLKLLLDEHISLKVVRGLQRHNCNIVVWHMREWEQGSFLGQTDEICLQAAASQQLTLVTYDCRTIPSLLKAWAEEERSHAGVILIDEKTIPPDDTGSLVWALTALYKEAGDWDWTNRMRFLRP